MRALWADPRVVPALHVLSFMQGAWVPLIVLAAVDLRWRRCPNWLSIPCLIGGVIMRGAEGMWIALAVGAILVIAKFPAGDVKGGAAMAGWLPWWAVGPGLVIVFAGTVLIMETQWYKLYQQAHRWPWLAGFAVSLTISYGCGKLILGT